MTTDAPTDELEAAIAEHALTDAEQEQARALLEKGGQLASIVPFILSERENADDGGDDPVDQPPAGADEPTAKQLAALDKEQVRHEKRVHEVMGAFVEGFVPCEKCGGVGLVAPGDPPPEPQPHEWFKPCETCKGFGQVLTGSLRAGQEARDCPACKGRGYLEAIKDGVPLAERSAAAAVEIPASPPAPALEPVANGSGDLTFGTPAWMGDPSLTA